MKLFIHLAASSLRTNSIIEIVWAGLAEECMDSAKDMRTLQTLDTEWKTLSVFEPFLASADRG